MDNLTHTLIGAVVAETATRVFPAARSVLPDTTRRSLYMALMVVGSNVPDLDSLYTGITGGKLGYLLHHRGHTHTVLGAIALAALMYAAVLGWLRWRRMPAAPVDRYWLAGLALFAPLLHLAMDATNVYGVHPFWPFNNAWYYGDAIFIIEPLFWAAAAPLVFLLRSRVARALTGLVLCIGIVLGFGSGLVPQPMAAGLTLLTASLLWVAWRASSRTAAASSCAVFLCIIGMFVLAGQLADRRVTALVAAQFPDAALLDRVLTALPVNPVCWQIILVQLEGDEYTLRRAMLSLAPGWLPAHRCPGFGMEFGTTLALTPVAVPDNPALQWHGEATMALGDIRTLMQANCEAAALSRYARALWIRREADGWLVGDLRYDREPQLGFAELAIPAVVEQCPRHVPPWIPPRNDVL
jgi:inner membrane protein